MAAGKPTPQPGRALGFVLIVLIGLYLGVAFGSIHSPKLGLDLRGGTSVILTASEPNHSHPSKSALDQAVNIIRNRINGNGVQSAQVTTQGTSNIDVEVPGKNRDQVVKNLLQTAQLRFRLVLDQAAGTATAATTPSPTPSSKASATPKPSPTTTASPKPKTTAKPKAAGAFNAVTTTAAYDTAASPQPSASPQTSAATTSAAATSAAATPAASASPSPGSAGVPAQTQFPPADEAAALTAFGALNCATDPDPTGGLDKATNWILACQGSSVKYLLGPAVVEGSQISSASASLDTTGQWVVLLNFNGSGTTDWANLTTQASKLSTTSCGPPAGCNFIAVVLDGSVVSAPTVNSGPITSGNTQISGSFDQTSANNLANELKYGQLPVHLSLDQAETISASLGSDQLRGGLIAGVIGLLLVVVYSLIYYRGLGLVTIASLVLSGGLLYALVTVLGEAIGYTLDLAGIVGFIVAVGITADSFVVFFERMRDAVREGRSLRSSVEFAWPRARRTILSADTVSILAAAVLYFVSIGDVRGFAFTLGLSTMCDLFIVFLFTKPLLTFLTRSKLFASGGRFTGMGAGRMGTASEAAVRLGGPGSGRARQTAGKGV